MGRTGFRMMDGMCMCMMGMRMMRCAHKGHLRTAFPDKGR